jgi:ABC transporter substrate binding protein
MRAVRVPFGNVADIARSFHAFSTGLDTGEPRDILAAARGLQQQVVVFQARTDRDLEAAFETFMQRQATALIVGPGPFLTDNSRKIVALAAQYKIPSIYPHQGFARGLMIYSADEPDTHRHAAAHVGRILKSEKPSDLPIVQAARFQLVINLETAKVARPYHSAEPARPRRRGDRMRRREFIAGIGGAAA